MEGLFQELGVGPIPKGVPYMLAISILTGGYTEHEARQMIEIEDISHADKWIEDLRNAGYFGKAQITQPQKGGTIDTAISIARGDNESDAGDFLWQLLKQELTKDENGLKLCIVALDSAVKGMGLVNKIDLLRNYKATDLVPPYVDISEYCNDFPWHGCKFAAIAVIHLLSNDADVIVKRDAARPVSRSLGGFTLPHPQILCTTRWPYELSRSFTSAKELTLEMSTCTAILVCVSDVEVMRNPSKGWASRPGTFAHCFVVTVSPSGVYLYQGYGPKGYTLLQHITKHDVSYPLSFPEAERWI